LQKRNIFHNFLSPPPKNDIDWKCTIVWPDSFGKNRQMKF
jgi:hypothetical protein